MSTSTSATVTSLSNGTSYIFRVAAVNSIGTGSYSTYSSASTLSTTPSAPTIGAVTLSSGSLSVAFTAGSDGGSAITSYKYSTDGGSTFRTRATGTTASPLVISVLSSNGTTTLTNGVAYNIQIKAVNANGDGAATASTSATPNSVAAALAISTQPVGNYSGSRFGTQPVVRVVDAAGNTMTTSTASVTVTASGGTLGGTTTVSAVAGIATFTNLTHTTAGSHTLTFASASPTALTSITSSSFTTTSNTCIDGGACVIGMVGPGGGVVFITPSTSGNTTGMYFEAAPATWNGGAYDPQGVVWSNNASALIAGADGTSIGTGYQNTLDMYAAESSSTTAAGKALDLNLGGVDDWFLPSFSEAIEMRTQCAAIGDLLCGTSLGYWTSTEVSASQAQGVKMVGTQQPGKNNNKQYTRPIRAFRVASALAVTTEPVGNSSGSVLVTQPVVRIVDAVGNTVATSSASVSVTASGGTLGGTTTVSAVAGIATFTNLTHTTAGSFTLTFDSTSPTALSSITSASFTTTAAPLTCATGGACALGNPGPGGGIVFYIAPGTFESVGSDCASSCKYLEAVTTNSVGPWTTGIAKCYLDGSDVGTANCQAGSIYSNTENQTASRTTGLEIGAGMANTVKIYERLTTEGGANPSTYAAGVALAYSTSSTDDWYLPSYLELSELLTRKSYFSDFPCASYIGSSERDRQTTYARNSCSGSFFGGNKFTTTWSYRAIRAFNQIP